MTWFRNHRRTAWLVGISGALILTAPGCLVLPIPGNRLSPSSRKDISPEVINEIAVGRTTREEVLLGLGEPDFWTADGGQYRYHWERIKWDIIVAAGGYGSAAVGDIPVNKNYDLVIRFDDAGVVTERTFAAKFNPSEVENPASSP